MRPIVLAHAFGARYDLPIPLLLFLLGGAAVVVVSFLLVFRRTVTEPDAADAPPDDVPTGRTNPVLGALSVLVLALLVAAGLAGSQETAENILPTAFWLLAWVGVPLSCGLLGDWTRPVNAFGVLARLGDRPSLRRAVLARDAPLPWPRALGWWPATLAFAVLVLGELVFNLFATRPGVIATGLLLYAVLSLFLGLLFGPGWLTRGEVFSVLFDVWGRLGYWRLGAPGRRGFAGGLDVPFERRLSRLLFVLLLLVSINDDGLLSTPQWARFERGTVGPHVGQAQALKTVSLVLLVVVVGLVFGLFALAAARAGRHGTGLRAALVGLLPSLLPIAFGYLVAHNAFYLLVNGQLLLPLLGNPVGLASWPVHLPYPFNDRYEPSPTFAPLELFWYVGLLAIIGAHVAAVVLAHRHLAGHGQSPHLARASEYPWLVAMVAYTVLSLYLIAQPLVQETGSATQAQAQRRNQPARSAPTWATAGAARLPVWARRPPRTTPTARSSGSTRQP